jgi:hypothetical protein
MLMKRKSIKRKSSRSMLPSWNEVRMGLSQLSKLRLLFLLAKIYRSSVVPKTVKISILSMAKTGAKKVTTKRKSSTRKKPRSAKQKAATRKLIALNKRRRK